ncbi:hypothetical protein BDR26DRAFT_849808 [Obelidium mucronatum]|nr:hypothetical protein BDR26DRAFT_849808 [Obelidium mucronatum]
MNTTTAYDPIIYEIVQPYSFALLGLCVEQCLQGIMSLFPVVIHVCLRIKRGKDTSPPPPAIFHLVFSLNAFLLVYDLTGFVLVFVQIESVCGGLYKLNNLIWHLFFIGFGAFMLWKSWIVTEKNRVFLTFATLALTYRAVWGIIDLLWSGGYIVFDSDLHKSNCEFDQNKISAFHCTIGDVASDVIATIGSLYMFFKPENQTLAFQSLWFQLAKENVIRSVVTLIVCVILIYLEQSDVHPGVFYVAFTIQEYVYIRLVNMEINYKETRSAINLGLRAGNLTE